MPNVSEPTPPCHSERSEEPRSSRNSSGQRIGGRTRARGCARDEILRCAQNDKDVGVACPGYTDSAIAYEGPGIVISSMVRLHQSSATQFEPL